MPSLATLIEREKLRTRIESAVTRLIEALDVIDGDVDAEDTHDLEAVNEDRDPLDEGELDEADHWQTIPGTGVERVLPFVRGGTID